MITFIFGDSITEGLWDSKGGWADRLKAYVQGQELQTGIKNYHEVYNLGVDGNTSKQVLERFENEVKARLWPDAKVAFIFAIGTNDTLHRNNADFESTPEQYVEELESLVKLARQYSHRMIFVGLTPVDESLTNPIASSSSGKCYTNERIKLFIETLDNFCQQNSLAYVDVFDIFMAQDLKTLLADGLHPNDNGHQLIYESVKPRVQELLGV